MSNELKITKDGGISLREWKLAARKAQIILVEPDNQSTVQFGKTVSIVNNDGDGVMMYGMAKILRFNYSNGEIRFACPEDFESPLSESRRKIVEIAKMLGAVMTDEMGNELN